MVKRFFIALVFVAGCTDENQDKSKTLDEYYQLGVPDIEEYWTPTDLTQCLDILASMRVKDFYAMPRRGSLKSDKLFKKLISMDIDLRFIDQEERNQVLTKLFAIYDEPALKRMPGYYHQELAWVMVSLIKFSDRHISYTDTLSQVILSSDAVATQLRRMGEDYATMVDGLFFYQDNSVAFSKEDQFLICNAMVNSLSKNWHHLSQESLNKLLPRMKEFSLKHRDSRIRKKYFDLLKSRGVLNAERAILLWRNSCALA